MDAEPPVDIWPYFDEIPPEDFQGYDCSEGVVVFAYDNNQGTYQHILVNSDADKVYMIIVIDLQNNDILGHRLVSFAAQQNQA